MRNGLHSLSRVQAVSFGPSSGWDRDYFWNSITSAVSVTFAFLKKKKLVSM